MLRYGEQDNKKEVEQSNRDNTLLLLSTLYLMLAKRAISKGTA